MITVEQEQKIIQLASEIAKNIVPIDELLTQLNINEEEWELISKTKTFNDVLNSSSAEWNGATNTNKRAKLKAAAVIETVLPTFYKDMVNLDQKLSDRAKVLETVAKIAGLGATENAQATQSGNVFRLQINLSNNKSLNLDMGTRQNYSESEEETEQETIEGDVLVEEETDGENNG